MAEVMLSGFVTNSWEFDFEQEIDPLGFNLPNGVRVPLPPRGTYWPKRKTTASFTRLKNRDAKISYRILLVPQGKDGYWWRKFLTEQAAESALSKVGAVMIGGPLGAVLAGLATVFVPSEAALTFMWHDSCVEGPVYGVTSGFNV